MSTTPYSTSDKASVTAASGATVGVPFKAGLLFGSPASGADAGEPVSLDVEALVAADKQPGLAMSQGDAAYWNVAGYVDDDSTNDLIGVVLEDAGASAARVNIRYLGQAMNPAALGAGSEAAVALNTSHRLDSYTKAQADARDGEMVAGLLADPVYVCPGDGTVVVSDVTAVLWDNATHTGHPDTYTVTGGTFTPAVGVKQYIVARYNAGSPDLYLETTLANINESDVIPVLTLDRDSASTDVYVLDWNSLGKGAVNKTHARLVKTQRFARERGLILSESVGRVVNVSNGVVWYGSTFATLGDYVSDVDEMREIYKTAGVWDYSVVTQYNNTHYNDGTDKVELTSNRYAINYVYLLVSDTVKRMAVLLGEGDYKLADAMASGVPVPPDNVSNLGVLVGRIIVEKNAATATAIQSAFDVDFGASPVSNHNDLSLLQGGTTDEYYHLTSAQHAALIPSAPVPVTTATFAATLAHAGKILHDTRTATGASAIEVASTAVADSTFAVCIKDAGLNSGTNNITITCEGGETIDGSASLVVNSDGASFDLYSDGSNLFIR